MGRTIRLNRPKIAPPRSRFTQSPLKVIPGTTVVAKSDVKFALQDAAFNATNLNVLREAELKATGVYHIEVLVDVVLKIRYPLHVVIPKPPPAQPARPPQ